jgi:hypothetical protein
MHFLLRCLSWSSRPIEETPPGGLCCPIATWQRAAPGVHSHSVLLLTQRCGVLPARGPPRSRRRHRARPLRECEVLLNEFVPCKEIRDMFVPRDTEPTVRTAVRAAAYWASAAHFFETWAGIYIARADAVLRPHAARPTRTVLYDHSEYKPEPPEPVWTPYPRPRTRERHHHADRGAGERAQGPVRGRVHVPRSGAWRWCGCAPAARACCLPMRLYSRIKMRARLDDYARSLVDYWRAWSP